MRRVLWGWGYEKVARPRRFERPDLCLRSNLTCPSRLFEGDRSDALCCCNCETNLNSGLPGALSDTLRLASDCSRSAYARMGVWTAEFPRLSSQSASSTLPSLARTTTSSGMMSYQVSGCASSRLASAAMSFNTGHWFARGATPSACLASGPPRARDRRRRFSWAVSPRTTTLSTVERKIAHSRRQAGG